MNSLIPLTMALAMLGFIWLAIRTTRKQKRERESVCREMGFTRVDQVPTDFTARIQSLRNGLLGKIEIHNMHIRGGGHYDLYLFDIWSRNRSDYGEHMAALVSHDLDLPSFRLFPNLPFSGKLANWLNKFVAGIAANQGYREYHPSSSTQFEQRYRLYVTDERAVSQALPHDIWERLAALQPAMCIEGHGDILMFSEFGASRVKPFRSGAPEEYRTFLRSLIDEGDRLYRIFGESRQFQAVH